MLGRRLLVVVATIAGLLLVVAVRALGGPTGLRNLRLVFMFGTGALAVWGVLSLIALGRDRSSRVWPWPRSRFRALWLASFGTFSSMLTLSGLVDTDWPLLVALPALVLGMWGAIHTRAAEIEKV